MDAIKLLKQDHDKVADLFKKIDATENEKQKLKIFEQVDHELTVHMHIEEAVLYPACKEHDDLKDMTLEAVQEHKQIKTFLREIPELIEGSEVLDSKLKVLKEDVEHHVKDEEEELFPKMRKVMTNGQIEELGVALEAAKKTAK